MKPFSFTPIVEQLPATIPFVGPETFERDMGRVFQARVGANESAFGISPKAREAMVEAINSVGWYNDPENYDLRLALAQQIETRIEGLDKTFANRVDANDKTTVGSTFSSVSKQLTKQTLRGSRVVKADIVDIAGKDYFCALTTLSPELTKTLFQDLVKETKLKIDPQDEQFLYQEFKAFKAEQDLEKEIARLTN